MKHEVDAVITELTIDIGYEETTHIGRASFIFIDVAPYFKQVNKYLDQIEEHDGAFVVDHYITTQEITEQTDISSLYVTRH